MDCKHCFHWDKASETFNTEIESCCDCGYVKFSRLNNAEEAIKRVRELHKPFWVNEAHCSECYSKYDEHGKYSLYPCETIKALDGEQ